MKRAAGQELRDAAPGARMNVGARAERRRRATSVDRNLLVRTLAAAVGVPLVLVVNYLGDGVFLAVVVAAALVAALEGYTACRAGSFRPVIVLGLAMAGLLAAAPQLPHPELAWRLILTLGMVLAALPVLRAGRSTQPFADWMATVMIAAYTGGFLGSLLAVRLFLHGAWLVFTILLITWAYDTGAYLVGRFYGRRPFMQHISPKKTMEGVAGGVVLSVIAALVCMPFAHYGLLLAVGLGLALAVAAQVGDLLESAFKRQVGIKDSGALIPGHGGLLDRIDSLLFTSVAAYAIFWAGGFR